MKKVFLSLATIAFVAVGSLTMTSCGDDESTPGPQPEPELTENFAKINGEQYAVSASEYTIDTDGDYEFIYQLEGVDGYFVKYSTYFYHTDVENPSSLADFTIYGVISYYVELQDVKFNDKDEIIDYTVVLPNQAQTLYYASAGAATNGTAIGKLAGAPVLKINALTLSQEGGTTDFDGKIAFEAGDLTFDYNGATGLYANDVAAAKGVSNFKAELKEVLKEQGADTNVKATRVVNLKKN